MNYLRRLAGVLFLSTTLGISGCANVTKQTASNTHSILTQQQNAKDRPNACPLDDCDNSGG